MRSGLEVITGFIGAGKSAFINSYIDKTKVKDEVVVVITMEDGNEKIKINNEVKHLVINSLEDEFVNSIYKAINIYKANRIIVEVNGTEYLEDVYKKILGKDINKICKLYTSYFICNANSIEFYIKNMGELLIPYIENSKVIILTNNKEINQSQLIKVNMLLEDINNKAHILSAIDKDFKEMLDSCELLENKYFTELRVKIMNYISKKNRGA